MLVRCSRLAAFALALSLVSGCSLFRADRDLHCGAGKHPHLPDSDGDGLLDRCDPVLELKGSGATVLDSQAAVLEVRIRAGGRRYTAEADWGDGSPPQRLVGREEELRLTHRYAQIGTFRPTLRACTVPAAWSTSKPFEVTVVDDDTSGPTVRLDMPRGPIPEGAPRKISWEMTDPSGLAEVRLELTTESGFRATETRPSGSFDFGDRGPGGYSVFVTLRDGDNDRPGDSAGGQNLHTFLVVTDRDGDGVTSDRDNCAGAANADQSDRDFDGMGDVCDSCPHLNGPQADSDGDGIGDGCDLCPGLMDHDPTNSDGDLLGDGCDPDDDNDALADADEERLGTDPRRRDSDGGGTPDGREAELGTDPNNAADDERRGTEVVSQFVPDRLFVRFAFGLPEAEVAKIARNLGVRVRGAGPTSGIYELTLPRGTSLERTMARLTALEGPSEEAHHGEQLAYPAPHFLGTFDWLEERAPSAPHHHPEPSSGPRRKEVPNDPRLPHQTGIVPLLDAWKLTAGGGGKQGPIIALLDTGLDLEHEDLRDNVWRNEDERPGDANGDGCPGVCGRDDDGDGKADFDDPEVRERLARNPDRRAAAGDDDENGYVDDHFGWDFATDTSDVTDQHGHGTHVAGVVGAIGNNGKGIAGVLWKARLMPLKVARRDGHAELDAIFRAMRYAAANGAEIVLHSYTITLAQPSDATIAELRALFGRTGTKNLLHVAAAGSAGRDLGRKRQAGNTLQDLVSDRGFFVFPESLGVETVIAVAAHDAAGKDLADFSNRGRGVVDMVAPGVGVLSTLPGNRYGYRDSTSAAAGYFAGVLGLLLTHYPELKQKPLEVVRLLEQRSEPFANPNILTSLFYQFTHPPMLTGTLYDETPFRFPQGFCGANTYDADLFDAEGDGDLDFLEVNGNPGTGGNEPRLFVNRGQGRFIAGPPLAGGALASTNLLEAAAADVDGDGDRDLIFASFTPPGPEANKKEILLLNQGALNFQDRSEELPDNFDVSRDVDFCDFNGDGRPEVFVTNIGQDRILRNDSLTSPTCWTTPTLCFTDQTVAWLPAGEIGDGHNAVCLDADEDGDLDVLSTNLHTGSSAGQNLLLINRLSEGVAAFVNETGSWNIPLENDTSHSVAVADIDDDNNDGAYGGSGDDRDLVIARRQFGAAGAAQNNLVLIDSGTAFSNQTFGVDGVPGGATDRLPNLPEASTEALLCDLDGDGDPDLLEANGDANYGVMAQNRFYRNRTAAAVDAGGEGYFDQQTSTIGIPLGYLQQSTDVECGDVDNDGDTDVLFANYGGCPELYISTRADTAPTITVVAPGTTLVGERITITGTNFGPVQGAIGRVTIGGVDAGTIYHWTNSRLVLEVPVGCNGNGTPGTCNGAGVPTPIPKGPVNVVVRTATGKVSAAASFTIACYGGPAVGGVCPGSLAAFTLGTSGSDADCSDDSGTSGFCLPDPFCKNSDSCNEPGVDAAIAERDIKDIEFGDLDNDGDLDILDVTSPNNVAHSCSPTMDFRIPDRLLLNQGNAEYRDITGGADNDWSTKADNPVPDFISNRTYDADLADINNDGLLDIVRADHQFCSGEYHYFVNQGGSPPSFAGGSLSNINLHAYWCEIYPGDVDGDGDLDLLLAKVAPNMMNAILLNRHHQGGDCITPNDCFEVWHPETAAPSNCPDWDDPTLPADSVDCRDDFHTFLARSHDLAWADLDGDRDLDVVIGGGTGQGPVTPVTNRILLNRLIETGEMFFEQIPIPNGTIADPTTGVMAADFNGDGRSDVHLANYAGGGGPASEEVDKLYLNLGPVECGSPAETACPDGLSCPACGPGTAHLVCNRICWRDATAQLPESMTGMPPTLLNSYGSDYGDVDGDGDLDFIAVTEFSNDSRLALNQGFKATSSTPPTWIACPTLTGAGVCPVAGSAFPATTTPADHDLAVYFGDADGDGDLDILWGSFNSNQGPFLMENPAVP